MELKRISPTSALLVVNYPDKEYRFVFEAETPETLKEKFTCRIYIETAKLVKRFVKHRIIALQRFIEKNPDADNISILLRKCEAAQTFDFHLEILARNKKQMVFSYIYSHIGLLEELKQKNVRNSKWNPIIAQTINFLIKYNTPKS